MSGLPLFTFAWAGGSAALYHCWTEMVAPDLTINPVELPGHGSRMREAAPASIQAAAAAGAAAMERLAAEVPYAVFGHSMGALVGFEAVHALRARGLPEPVHLFVSGRRAPTRQRRSAIDARSSDQELLDWLRRLGGTPGQFFEHAELLDLVLPVLRSDLAMLEQYRLPPNRPPLSTDISVLYGAADDIHSEELEEWSSVSSGHCTFTSFRGGHFYLHETARELIFNIVAVLRAPRHSSRPN